MKKILCLVTLLCLMAFPALAQQVSDTLAPAYSDSSAQLLSQEMEDGLQKTTFWLPKSNEIMENFYDPTLHQLVLDEFELQGDDGGTSMVLTEAEAQAKLLQLYPDASIAYIKSDTDDRRYYYEIVFTTAEFTGVTKVNAATGMLMKRELYYIAMGNLSLQSAQEAVLAQWPECSISFLVPELDDGRLIYDGDVVMNEYGTDMRVTFELDPETMTFFDIEKRLLDPNTPPQRTAEPSISPIPASSDDASTSSSGLIGTAKAMEIAQQEIGGGQVTSIKLDREHGRQVYEVEAIYNNYEYELEIDAQSGEILKWEQELDD